MKIKFLGQSCFTIEFGGKRLIIDPFISGNELAKGINVDDIKVDYILLTHGHQDHVLDAERIAKNSDATIISNFEITQWYGVKGITTHPLNHGGKWKFDFGYVKYVNAVHSSVLPDGTYGGNPGGFVVWNDDNCFYHAGDTALTWDMKLIPISCPALDVAILPIGDDFTMGYEDAAMAAEFVECNKVIGCHYDTFGYIKIDKDAVNKHFESKKIELILMDIDSEINI